MFGLIHRLIAEIAGSFSTVNSGSDSNDAMSALFRPWVIMSRSPSRSCRACVEKFGITGSSTVVKSGSVPQ